jgi:hypothetical protein
MSARNSRGVMMGEEVLKLSPDGKVLMMLGKEGIAGTGPDDLPAQLEEVGLRAR